MGQGMLHNRRQLCHGVTARQRRRTVTKMGLFGLGAPEIAVIAGVVALIYGELCSRNEKRSGRKSVCVCVFVCMELLGYQKRRRPLSFLTRVH